MDRLPVYFTPHGGGPWHMMPDNFGDPAGYGRLKEYLIRFGHQYQGQIKGLLIISAHWEENLPTVHFGTQPALLYDYYGFPEYTYRLSWKVRGNPELAQFIENLLQANGFRTRREYQRGYDHGVFVPLMIAFPEPDFPIIQLSLVNTLDPGTHIQMGRALAPLRHEGVLIVGSGMSYHNMYGFLSNEPRKVEQSTRFDSWLSETIANPDANVRNSELLQWENAPEARNCHPRSEHLAPLFVVAGAAESDSGKVDYAGDLMGVKISAYKLG